MFGSNSQKVVRKYDTDEMIRLSFDTVNENFGKFIKWLLKSVLIVIVFYGLVLLISSSYRNVALNQLERYVGDLEIDPNILIALDVSANVMGLLISMLFIIGSIVVCGLMMRTIVGLNTGDKNIESKKVIIPKGSDKGKQFLIAVLATVIVTLTLLTETAAYLNKLSLVPIYIFAFYLNMYISFTCFELASNGKSFSKALSNSYINLFYSKNNVITKIIIGKLVFKIIAFIGGKIISYLLMLAFLGTAAEASYLTTMFFTILLVIIGIVYVIFVVYLWFVDINYTYLVYILNEVKDKEVSNLK